MLPTPVLPLLLVLLVCDALAAVPVADAPTLVGLAVALTGRTLVEAEAEAEAEVEADSPWLDTLTALPCAFPAIHLATSSLCSRK